MADLKQIIDNLVSQIVWPVFVGLSVIMFIYSGFMFLTANGDPNKITQAKQALIWAIIGIGLGILAYSIPAILKNALNA